jgi:hypothetical protein
MAFSWRALAGAVVLLTACGSPSFTTAGDGGDVDGGQSADGGSVETGADAAPTTLTCPGATGGTCDLRSVCCIARTGGGFAGSCQAGSCQGGGGNPPAQLACTSSLQCPGPSSVCCLVRAGGGGGTSTSKCSTTAACTTGAVLCEMGQAGGCTTPVTCATTSNPDLGLPPELGTCGGLPPK